jgi:hypothetical protein
MINDGEIADDPNNHDEEIELNEKEQLAAQGMINARIDLGDESQLLLPRGLFTPNRFYYIKVSVSLNGGEAVSDTKRVGVTDILTKRPLSDLGVTAD